MDATQLFRRIQSTFRGNRSISQSASDYIPLSDVETSAVETINGEAHRRVSLNVEHETDSQAELNGTEAKPSELSEEDRVNLRRVSDDIPFAAFLIVIVEFCERASTYGMLGPCQNFLQNPLPEGGPGTGAPASFDDPQPAGALNLGQARASASQQIVGTFAMIFPLVGAYVADTRWGKYKTIIVSCVIYFIGATIGTIASTPASLRAGTGFLGWLIGAMIISLGAGGIKANVSPLVAEQYRGTEPFLRTLSSGERVIVDPNVTITRIYNVFYLFINIGSLSSVITTYLERAIGFWAAFLLPMCLFLLTPAVFLWGSKLYHKVPPKGSIFGEAMQITRIAFRGVFSHPLRFYRESRQNGIWMKAKPSYINRYASSTSAIAVTWDDYFVDELRRTALACQVSLFMPLYWLSYSQMTTNLISQAATMTTNGTPNDLIANLNPLALIIVIPLLDVIVYPAMRRNGYALGSIFRIWLGFMTAALAMAYTAALQYYIYRTNPCGSFVSSCEEKSSINVWVQAPSYILIAISEIFTYVTSLEYAYNKAPKRMKSVVMSFFMLMIAAGTAITASLSSFAQDPYLVKNYAGVGFATFVAGNLFYLTFSKRDQNEEEDNAIGREPSDTTHSHYEDDRLSPVS